MAIYSYTLDQLVERTCKLYLHDWWEGSATSTGSTVALADTTRTEADDYFNSISAELYLRTGTYAGVTRRITDFVNTGGTIVLASSVGGNIPSGSTYSIHSKFPRAEVVEAINDAIDQVAEEALFWKVDETVALAAATYEYEIPASFMYVTAVTVEDGSGGFRETPVSPSLYKIVHSTPAKIQFTPSPTTLDIDGFNLSANEFSPTATYHLRIEGLAAPAILSADTDSCPISPKYICAQAAATLCYSRAGLSSDIDYVKQANTWQEIANLERSRVVKMQLPWNAKRVRE